MNQKNKVMSQAERARRRAAIGKAASEKIAKSEQLNFRIEEQKIKELQDMAYNRGLPVSTMVYDWVLERLAQEKLGKSVIAGQSLQLLSEIHGKLHNFLDLSNPPSKGGMKVAESGVEYRTQRNVGKQ